MAGYLKGGLSSAEWMNPMHFRQQSEEIEFMLLDELRSQKDAIEALSTQYGARRLRLFGSVARGEEGPDSDVDFLVDFPRGYDLFAQRLPLTEQLSELLKRRVELVPEHELNRHMRELILKEAVEL